MKGNGALIGLAELLEALAQFAGGVGDILHDMGREPNLLHAKLFVAGEDLEGFLHGLYSIIYSREDVAMPLCESLEDSTLAIVLFEKKHFMTMTMTRTMTTN